MPLTDLQRAALRPHLAALREQCAPLAPPERARVIRLTLEAAGAAPARDEWAAFLRDELGDVPPELTAP